jgi:outer membrane protein assembly factor BamB
LNSNILFIGVLTILVSCSATHGAELESEWPQWRGPENNGSVETGDYLAKWTADSILWKSSLPGVGCSTPIIWDKRIFVTAPVEGSDALLAFDWSGKQVWQTKFGKENPGKHRNGSGSNPSPATDGKSVFVNFKSGTLATVDLDGKILWQTNLIERFGPDTLFWDHGSTPILTDKFVVMTRMHKGESWLAAFDKGTGELNWKVARNYETPTENDHGYSTPLVIKFQDAEALLVWGGEHLTIHDANNGKVLWTCGNFNPDGNKLWPTIAMPVVVGNMAVVPYGRNDRGIPRLHGIRLSGEGDVTDTNRIWKRDDIGTFVPTPVAYKEHVYMVGDKGRVTCLDPKTGESVWSDNFPRSSARFYGSPLIANGKIFAPREDGVVFVADITDGFKLLAENDLGESIIASPVPAVDRLFLRGEKNLFCIGTE